MADNDNENWLNTKDNVRWLLARANILELGSLRVGSTKKMVWVHVGWIAQLTALGTMFVAVGTILLKAITPGIDGWWDVFVPP